MLLEMTGQKSVPNVFINKTHVGGCDKTMQVRITFSFYYGEEMSLFGGWKEPNGWWRDPEDQLMKPFEPLGS